MKSLSCLIALVFFAGFSFAQERKMPCECVDCGCKEIVCGIADDFRLYALEKRVEQLEARLMPAMPKMNAPAAKSTVKAPQGHTHTCPKCGTVWDHSTNPGHNCPNCGVEQRYQDQRPKMITVQQPQAVTYSAPPVTYSAPPVTYSAPPVTYSAPPVTYSQPTVTFGASGGGCANGSCSSSSGPKRAGLFGRWR